MVVPAWLGNRNTCERLAREDDRYRAWLRRAPNLAQLLAPFKRDHVLATVTRRLSDQEIDAASAKLADQLERYSEAEDREEPLAREFAKTEDPGQWDRAAVRRWVMEWRRRQEERQEPLLDMLLSRGEPRTDRDFRQLARVRIVFRAPDIEGVGKSLITIGDESWPRLEAVTFCASLLGMAPSTLYENYMC
jgi:hypothetical protein